MSDTNCRIMLDLMGMLGPESVAVISHRTKPPSSVNAAHVREAQRIRPGGIIGIK